MTRDYILERSKNRGKNRPLYNEILRIYNYKCAICSWKLPERNPDGTYNKQSGCDIHHIIPYKDKGSESLDNLILLCPNCHKLADTGNITVDTVKQYLRLKPLSGIDWLRDNYKHLYNKIG